MSRIVDLTGNVYGDLAVVELAGVDKGRNSEWLCKCRCGKKKVVKGFNLKNGNTRSCGCIAGHTGYRGGLSTSSEYSVWQSMIQRCGDKNHKDYPNYGGRGISVCERWKENFGNFYDDMGKRPSDEYSLDRIDVNGYYERCNCRWATWEEQNQNQRMRKSNKTGVNGVSFHKASGKYTAQISVHGKVKYLGLYENIKKAENARKQAEIKYWNKSL